MVDWSDLRYFLAVSRTGSLAAAAVQLRVDSSTVGRRLSALEAALGSRLFDKSPQGYRLTESGRAMVDSAERVEQQVLALERGASGQDRALEGRVTLTTTEALAADLLMPHLEAFTLRHPAIELSVHTSNRELNLSRREADIALRAVRPRQADLVAVPAGALSFALYGAERYLLRHGAVLGEGLAGHAVVSFTDELAKLPQAIWLREVAAAAHVVVRSNSILAQAAAVEAGLGLGVLPAMLARRRPSLHRLEAKVLPRLDLWLVVHRDLRRTPRIRAVVEHLQQILRRELV